MPAFVGRIKSGYENVRYVKTGGTVDYAEPVDNSSPVFIRDLTSGTAANQANWFFKREYTIASGGNQVVDLNGTSIQDIFGTNLAMTSAVSVMVINRAVDDALPENTTNVTMTTTLPGLPASVVLTPGPMVQFANANAGGVSSITPTSADTITLTNASGASARVQICVIGRG